MNDITIIGAGPAGFAAAIYLKRAGIQPLIFEKTQVGGLLVNANLVENYPGFPEGISGSDLVNKFRKQLNYLNIEITKKKVTKVIYKEGNFHIIVEDQEIISSALIIASGTKPKKLGLSGETQLFGRKLFYEIKDIPPPTKNDKIVIVGGGTAHLTMH